MSCKQTHRRRSLLKQFKQFLQFVSFTERSANTFIYYLVFPDAHTGSSSCCLNLYEHGSAPQLQF